MDEVQTDLKKINRRYSTTKALECIDKPIFGFTIIFQCRNLSNHFNQEAAGLDAIKIQPMLYLIFIWSSNVLMEAYFY
jgi:hypothetical protein